MAGTTINPYRFGGQLGYRRDGPNRLYIRERHLDTTRGRWLGRDPFFTAPQPANSINTDSNSFNFYWYAKNRPTFSVDPSGLQDFPGGGFPGPIPYPPNPIINPFPIIKGLCQPAIDCAKCGKAVDDAYGKDPKGPKGETWYHNCNHGFVHCAACCLLTKLYGPDCALNLQNIQDRKSNPILHGGIFGHSPSYACRVSVCQSGVACASAASCFSCCMSKHPFNPPHRDCSGLVNCKGRTLTSLPPVPECS